MSSHCIRFKHLKETEDYFDGKARLMSMIVQGSPKGRLNFSNCYGGQEFFLPIHLQKGMLTTSVLGLCKRLIPNLRSEFGDGKTASSAAVENDPANAQACTYFMYPTVCTAQQMHVRDTRDPKSERAESDKS